MPRPSRHLDRALLAAGRELLPVFGCSGLTIRQVAEAADVNIGMFHYHFRTREIFLREVMQGAYEEMFSQLALGGERGAGFAESLRTSLRVLGRFLEANRALVGRILADALNGETVARDFLRDNLPRHVRAILGLVKAGQAAGELRAMDPTQAFAFCAGALAMPILIGGAVAESGALDAGFASQLQGAVLTDEALDERIDLAIAAIAAGPGRRKGVR
ncbi:MAG TPA: TetR family transcriptional regulator [Usitatibacteraceae bacterium]|nr:TetR family transcriptional regulator [Usitatibacteraceae bacterium]